MNEAAFQRRVTDMATRFGWRWWHVPAPMRWDPKRKTWVPASQGAGLPDLILTHDDPPRLVFLELKRKGGKLTDKQQEFLQAVKRVAERTWIEPELVWMDSHAPPHHMGGGQIIGVVAAWPDDEERIEQMLRSKNVT